MIKLFYCNEFKKDLKQLRKQSRNICSDLDNILNTLCEKIRPAGIMRIPLGKEFESIEVFKHRSVRCKDMQSTRLHRIIFFYDKECFYFIEFYFKCNNRNNHDEKLIKQLLNTYLEGSYENYFFELPLSSASILENNN